MVNNVQNSAPISPLAQPFNWVSVPLEEVIAAGLRLEASVYATEAKKAKLKIENGRYGSISLSQLVDNCFYPGRFKRDYRKKSENLMGFIGSAEMLATNPEPQKWMPPNDVVSVIRGQLLLSRSGTIGKVTYVNETLSKLLVSEHAIRISAPKFAGYLYAFFKSEYGYLITNSLTHGSVVSQIEPSHILSIKIPNAPDTLKAEIHQLVVDSFALRDESNQLLQQAEQLLKTALKLPALEAFEQRDNQPYTFSINSQQLAGRFEANFHHPVVQKIEQHLKQHAQAVSSLSDRELVNSIFLPGRYKRYYVSPEFGVPFLGGKEILELDPRGEKYLSLKQHGDRIAEELQLKENMILVTRSGTIGKVVLIPSYWENWVASEHLLRINPKSSELAGYLYVWLNSPWALPLIQRHTYGSVIFEIDQHHLANVSVPLLEKSIMQEINSLALQANQLRNQAFEKEQQALAKFESVL